VDVEAGITPKGGFPALPQILIWGTGAKRAFMAKICEYLNSYKNHGFT